LRFRDLTNTRIGITGSPATGKRSVARELAKLTGLKPVFLNDVAVKKNIAKRRGKEFEIDPRRLKRLVGDTHGKIVVGHMLPDVVEESKLDFVAVLRSSPVALRTRYLARKYETKKIEENLLAEFLDEISFHALKRYGREKVSEFDTSRASPRTVALRIMDTLKGKNKSRYGEISWSRGVKSSEALERAIYFSRKSTKR
jgi:adenylate kinase